MKNNKNIIMLLIAIIAVLLLSYFLYNKSKNAIPVNVPVTPVAPIVYSTIYSNKDYGFAFTLPSTWNGYTVVKNSWEGNRLNGKDKKETGPKLLIRNPKWTESKPYEDIPVLVFTTAQWALYLKEGFSIGAAPIKASELGANNKYVFALPARWNFDYSEGYKEAEDIINANPLEGFDIK